MTATRLHTLGRIELTAADGRVLHTVLAQPKRLLLLAHLAAAHPAGLRRRDALVALFWPEAPEARARAALSQALTFLRRAVGDAPIVTRGVDEVGVDGAHLWCDACEFERRLDAGDTGAALDLYQGDFLAALHVSDAPELERWLEHERARLRGRAAAAAGCLADDALVRGDVAGALRLAERAFDLAGDDERALRRLMTAHDRAGDRAGALRVYEDAVARLRADLAVEPAPETVALAGRLRERGERTPPVADERRTAPSAAPLPASAFLDAPSRRRWTPRRTRRSVLVALLLAVATVGALVGPALWQRRAITGAGPTAPAPLRLAVLPFHVRALGDGRSHEADYLREGLVELLSRNLDGAGALRAMDARAVLAQASDQRAADGDRTIDRAAAARLAARLHASHVVLGDAIVAGDRVRIAATIYAASEEGRPLHAAGRAEVEGETTQLFGLVDQLTLRLLAAFPRERAERLAGSAARTTSSLPALKLYLRGEALLRAQRWTEALDLYLRATTLDPSFALAHYRLSAVADWAARAELVRPAAERAYRTSGRLGTHDSLLVHANRAFRHEQAGEAERLYRQVVATWPDDAEAWYHLGEVLFHQNERRGRSIDEAREPFARVLHLDPMNEEVQLHLLRLAAHAEQWTEVDALSRRILAQLPPHRRLEVTAFRALTVGTPAEAAAALAALRHGTVTDRYVTTWRVAVFGRRLDAAERVARTLAVPDAGVDMQVTGLEMLAGIHMAQGRRRAAVLDLATMHALRPSRALVLRSLYAVLPVAGASAAELVRLRTELRAATAPAGAPIPPTAQVDGLLVLHATGIVSAALGDTADAQAVIRRLSSGSEPDLARTGAASTGAALARTLAASVAAHVAWRGGRPHEGLELLDGAARAHSPMPSTHEPLDRLVRAELLRALGRSDEALGWYASLGDVLYEGVPLLGVAELRQAQIHHARGDHARAARHAARFRHLWAECDTDLRPLVAFAAQLGASRAQQ